MLMTRNLFVVVCCGLEAQASRIIPERTLQKIRTTLRNSDSSSVVNDIFVTLPFRCGCWTKRKDFIFKKSKNLRSKTTAVENILGFS